MVSRRNPLPKPKPIQRSNNAPHITSSTIERKSIKNRRPVIKTKMTRVRLPSRRRRKRVQEPNTKDKRQGHWGQDLNQYPLLTKTNREAYTTTTRGKRLKATPKRP